MLLLSQMLIWSHAHGIIGSRSVVVLVQVCGDMQGSLVSSMLTLFMVFDRYLHLANVGYMEQVGP